MESELDLSLSLHPPKIQKLENESQLNDDDIISRLPDEILLQILSLLPEGNAQATGILSKRWKEVWALLPDLRFVMPYCCDETEVKQYMDFIHRNLTLRDGRAIRKLSLFLRSNCDYDRVDEFINCAATHCKVQELDLCFIRKQVKVDFPWDNFKSLVAFTLRGQFVLDVPETVLFPCLKSLTLLSVVYSAEASIYNLFSGCPVLEKLRVVRHQIGMSATDNVMNFNLSVTSLKVLNISFAQTIHGEHGFLMNAPNLEELNLVDRISSEFHIQPLPLIVSAALHVDNGNAIGLLRSVSGARTLTIGGCIMMKLNVGRNIYEMPRFENLLTLKIGYDNRRGWLLLGGLLHKMPNLEDLTFYWGLIPSKRTRERNYRFNFFPPADVPACLLSKLANVTIYNERATTEEEAPLIRYFLRFGKSLKTLTMNDHNIDPSLKKRLLRYSKRSNSCQINLLSPAIPPLSAVGK